MLIIAVLLMEIYYKMLSWWREEDPVGTPTSNPCQFNMDYTSIRWRTNFEEFPRHSHVLFWCNFTDRKFHVVATYFFRRNFDGRKIHVLYTYFFRCNFDGGIVHVVSTYFFQCNFDGRKIDVVSMYFSRYNFHGQKIHLANTYFFWCNFSCRNIHGEIFYLLFSS